jgi:hypothetical protein
MTVDLRQTKDELLADLDPIQHLRNLDYPRRAGTEGDRQGVTYIAQTLRDNGIDPVVQEFQFAKRPVLRRLLIPLVLLVWTVLSMANIRIWDSNPIISLFVLLLPGILIAFILAMNWIMPYVLGRRRTKLLKTAAKIQEGTLPPERVISSQNVLAFIGPEDAEQEILFTAHHDSIAGKLPRKVTGICAILGFAGFVLYSLAYLANTLTQAFLDLDFLGAYYAVFAVLALVGLIGLGIFFVARLFRGNASHGIIDDGTGVAILLELAKHLKTHEIPGVRFTFGFFGAEEAGLVGSTHYYLHREVDKSKLRVITIDMIGEKPPLAYVKGIFLVGKRRLGTTFNEQIVEIAQALDIQIKGKTFPYPGSDFGHFLLDGGCTTNWLINGSRMIHSKRDKLDNVNQDLVRGALQLMVAYLSRIRRKSQDLAQPAGKE